MTSETLTQRPSEPVLQFSIFTPNRLGRLHDFTRLLASHEVHIMALTVLDTTDSAIVRVVVDDPDRARVLFREHDFHYAECEVLAVEIDSEQQLKEVLAALLEAEINIHYTYSFLHRPRDRAALVLSLEDHEVAEQALRRHQFTVLRQGDIAR